MDQLFTWQMLITFAGCSAATGLVTAAADRLFNRKKAVPTQVISYLVAVAVLLLGHQFTGGVDLPCAVLCLLNGMLVAGATSGAISGARRLLKPGA